MLGWLEKKTDTGWTAVDAAGDGLYGVSVLPPHTSGGKPRVLKYGAMPGRQLDANTLAELAGKISVAGCRWTLPLERKAYTLLVVEEPMVLPDELEQSVRWTIGTLIDYPVGEANIAVMKIPTATLLPNRAANIYVVAAKRDVVARYNDLFRQARLSLQAIDVRETAQRNIAALAEKPGEGAGLLSIGKRGVHFTITFNGELYFDRFVEEPLLVDPLADADAIRRACERVVLQLQRSLDYIGRNLQFINIDRILLAPMPNGPSPAPFSILVVEDDADLRQLYELKLCNWPMQPHVRTARDVNDGYEELIRMGHAKPDLLIADLQMLGMDGFRMLKTISNAPELAGMAIVVVSGLDAEEIVRRGGVPDGIPVLPKPVPFDQLRAIAEQLVAERDHQKMLADFIAQHIQVPVETLDLGSLFDFSETPELARKENQAPYFFALGAALRFMKKAA